MSGMAMGLGILGIGFGAILLAIVGTVLVTGVRNFREKRQPPKFTVEADEPMPVEEGPEE